jgi:hypothetical protein
MRSLNLKWVATAVLAAVAGGVLSYAAVSAGVVSLGASGESDEAHWPDGVSMPGFTDEETERLLTEDFPVYWVGDQFQGLEAVRVMGMTSPPMPGVANPPTNTVKLIYGNCVLPGETSEGLPPCEAPYKPAPLEITTEPYCTRRPEFVPDSLKEGDFTVRGAEAHWVSGAAQLRLYTQDVTITVTGKDRESVMAVAEELTSLTPSLGTQSPGSPLGPVTASCAAPPPPVSPAAVES